MFEYDGVWDVHSYLNSYVRPISRNIIKSDILDTYRIEKRKKKNILQSVQEKQIVQVWGSIRNHM